MIHAVKWEQRQALSRKTATYLTASEMLLNMFFKCVMGKLRPRHSRGAQQQLPCALAHPWIHFVTHR